MPGRGTSGEDAEGKTERPAAVRLLAEWRAALAGGSLGRRATGRATVETKAVDGSSPAGPAQAAASLPCAESADGLPIIQLSAGLLWLARAEAARPAAAGLPPAPLDPKLLLEQLHGRLERLALTEGGRAELVLEPARLGRLTLRLERDGAGWRLEIHSSLESTARELHRQAQDLRDSLAGAGLRLDELRLTTEAGPARHTPGEAGRESGAGAWHEGDDPDQRERARREEREESARSAGGAEHFANRLERLLHVSGGKGARP
jgi:flagellar hook-length control protein FliK